MKYLDSMTLSDRVSMAGLRLKGLKERLLFLLELSFKLQLMVLVSPQLYLHRANLSVVLQLEFLWVIVVPANCWLAD